LRAAFAVLCGSGAAPGRSALSEVLDGLDLLFTRLHAAGAIAAADPA
jgi:hypothetical protein